MCHTMTMLEHIALYVAEAKDHLLAAKVFQAHFVNIELKKLSMQYSVLASLFTPICFCSPPMATFDFIPI